MSNKLTFPQWPYSTDRESQLLEEVLKSGKWWRMNGSKVVEFENRFAEYHNTKYCLGLTNGTHAIELALATLGIGSGDEVLVPAFTFIATATAVFYNNAAPIPVDCDANTFCVDPESIESMITKKTKVIICVHMAGHMCDMGAIGEIAKKYNLFVIEDAAHAQGGEWKNKKAGEFGDITTFSFQNGKLMTCGEGGALITNNRVLYEKAILIHGVGRPLHDKLYKHLELGSNYRMSEFQAAILLAQLERLPKQNLKREKNAETLDSYLSPIVGITPQGRCANITVHTHYMYMFYFDSAFFGGLDRASFVDALIELGIPAFIAYPSISNTEFFKANNFRSHISFDLDRSKFNIANSERIEKEVVWFPHHVLLSDSDKMAEIATAIKNIQKSNTRKS